MQGALWGNTYQHTHTHHNIHQVVAILHYPGEKGGLQSFFWKTKKASTLFFLRANKRTMGFAHRPIMRSSTDIAKPIRKFFSKNKKHKLNTHWEHSEMERYRKDFKTCDEITNGKTAAAMRLQINISHPTMSTTPLPKLVLIDLHSSTSVTWRLLQRRGTPSIGAQVGGNHGTNYKAGTQTAEERPAGATPTAGSWFGKTNSGTQENIYRKQS